jgi:hypothetical protein
MKSLEQMMIVKDGMYNSFPSIARTGEGKLAMVFRQAENSLKKYGKVTHVDPSSKVAMVTSADDGATWSPVRVIYDDEMGEQDPCLTCLSDGTLICTFFRWRVVPVEDKHLLGEAFKYYGRIVFDRWAAVHIGTVCIRSQDGSLLAPLYGTKKLGEMSRCLIVASKDQGRTWYPQGEIPGKEGHHFLEPFLYRAPSGRLDIFMRTQLDFFKLPFDQTYLNLHVSSSHDDGASWTSPAPSPLFCPNPVHVLPIAGGQVLVSFGQRKDPKGIEAIVTDAETPVLHDADRVMVRPAEDGDLGYTSAVGLHDGTALVVYYMTDAEQEACIGATKVGL